MSLYTIGDLHLSLGGDKSMDAFGGRWENYVEKLTEGFKIIKPQDVTVLCGDLTWGMSLEDARLDFEFIGRIPGKKIILKGNHDYWWTTAAKAYKFFEENGIENVYILNNNCYFYGDTAICGTRGWFYEEEKGGEHDKKILAREVLRLEASLNAAGDREKIVFLHYPPKYNKYECPEILNLLKKHGVKRCFFGHIHGAGLAYAFEGFNNGCEFRLISADHVKFAPQKVL